MENRRESRKEKHKTKILVKYGLCKCPPFQRSCRKVPPLLFFPCMNLSSLFLIQEQVKDVAQMPVNSQRQVEKTGNGKRPWI